jgi:hypothetical protein
MVSPDGHAGNGCLAKREQARAAGWKRLIFALLPSAAAYRPERHYMRGPGPKWRERRAISVWAHDPSNNA